MENLQNAIGSTENKDAIGFKNSIVSELASRLHAAISERKQSVADGTQTEETVDEANVLAPSAPAVGAKAGIPGAERANFGAGEVPDPLEDELRDEIENAFRLREAEEAAPAAEAEDTSLDPNFEKEFLIKETEYKGHKVTIKQVGLGLSKPVRVYVDQKRWEFFPGPEVAMKSVKNYIDEMTKKKEEDTIETEEDGLTKAESVETNNTISEKVGLDGRTRLYRETKMRIEHQKKWRDAVETKESGKTSKVDDKELTTEEMIDSIRMIGDNYEIDEAKLSPKQKEYRKFFKGALDKHGEKSPANMGDEKKKKFFNYVKTNWAKK